MDKKHQLKKREVIGDPPRYITINGLSRLLGVSERTVRSYISKGLVSSRTIKVIPWSEVEKLDLEFIRKHLM